ncbi:FRG domain-containing protein [Clostridium sp. MT-14]|uniref:FRG domain-containing protein n=1 Tax=Clostridium sp. MT-14 TaxID=3348360 RepID=UPI0035F22B17
MDKWLEIIDKVSWLQKQNKILWFRGHRNIDFKLRSTLSRIDSNKRVIKNKERDMYNYFINYGYKYIEKFIGFKEWNILFLMQHYGLPTRLLDWTNSFIKALYFANKGRNEGEDACIWVLNPIELNRECNNRGFYVEDDCSYNKINLLTIDKLPERIKNYINYFEDNIARVHSFALVPNMSNERLVAQNGFFTVQGTELLDLEEEYCDCIDKFLFKINLPYATYEQSINFIKVNGINCYTIYGGVDGLCEYIKDELMGIKMNNL